MLPKSAEADGRPAEARYQLLFETNPLPTWLVDPLTGRILIVNHAAIRHYGYSREEFLAMTINELRVPEMIGPLAEFVRPVASPSAAVAGSFLHRRKDGSECLVQLAAEKTSLDGAPALMVFVRDPEREEAIGTLKVRERQLAQAQALAHVGSWEWDIRSNHVTWSPELHRVFGVDVHSPAGYTEFIERVHPADRDQVGRIIAESLTTRTPTCEYRCRIVRPSGEIRHLLNRHVVVVDDSGEAVTMAGTCLDVSERSLIEQQLEVSERHHRELVENASDIVTVVSPEGVVRYMSPSVERLLGYGRNELVGQTVFGFIHPDDAKAVREAMQRDLAAPGIPHAVEFRFQHRDGSWRVLEAVGQARRGNAGEEAIIVNSRDVTDRKLAEEKQQSLMNELRSAQETAEAATRAKSEFLANMSHEIRTPMNAVLGLTEVLLDTTLSAEQRRHLTMVRDSGDVLLTLLNDILDLSKIEADRIELETIAIALPHLVNSTVGLFTAAGREKNLELRAEIGAGVPPTVEGDPTRIRQILTNLIGNAIKFTHKGRIVVSVSLVRTDQGTVTLRLAVKDTGIGIPADRIESIFHEFSQIDASTSRRFGGTGLGLAIARRLVRLMGGEISVTSEPGVGSEFAFAITLPLASAPLAEPRSVAPAARRKLQILLAEDNLVNQQVALAMLRKRGHEVTVAINGERAVAAVAAAAEGFFDVVLMDIHMPEMDGYEATAAIRKLPCDWHVPIIAVTADALTGERERCLAAGMDDYLSKPFRADQLFAITEKYANRTHTLAAGADTTDHRHEPVDVDWFRAMMRQAGAEDAVASILDSFMADAPHQRVAVLSAVESGNADAIRSAAHAFKSAAGSIGARDLAALLLEIEVAGKTGHIDDARVLTARLPQKTDEVIGYLHEVPLGELIHG